MEKERKNFDKQLKKGVLEMILLNEIKETPAYGYDLRIRIKEKSKDRLIIEDGTMYPLLYRLESDGCIVAKWSTENDLNQKRRTPPKKIYTITSIGIQRLEEERECWNNFYMCINSLLY